MVERPWTDYLRWQLHSLRIRAECGERVRMVDAVEMADSEEFGQLPEIVVLGGRTLYQVRYSEAGIPAGAIRYTDPDLVLRWEGYLADLHRVGEDVLAYFEREAAHGRWWFGGRCGSGVRAPRRCIGGQAAMAARSLSVRRSR
ncbi:DUF6879 family protein [Kitasatospora sp. NPDC056800]|uniref:DUF6879 family protein n=1 Tax=Kitasatospora sp. NPDC056800 TaxID=3345948 RepID=UPI003685F8AF